MRLLGKLAAGAALIVAITAGLAPMLVSAASPGGSAKQTLPLPRPGSRSVGPDGTQPDIMGAVTAQLENTTGTATGTRQPVMPLRQRATTATTSAPAAQAGVATAAGTGGLQREVFGFAYAGNLGDPNVGYTTWSYSLLSTIAYFGLDVNGSTGHFIQDTGWNTWHSSLASSLINTAHANGVRVVVTVIYQDNTQGMCTALANGATTISDLANNMLGADGVNIDYEGTEQTCPDGQPVDQKLVSFVQAVRNSGLGYLSLDVYSASPEGGGFFSIPALAPNVDSLFAMDYGMEASNGPCATCMGPTAPLTSGPNGYYTYNVTRSAQDYQPWATKTILGFPYYGVKGCTAANPGPNAPITPGTYGADPYSVVTADPADPNIQNWSQQRDAQDPQGQEPWATYYSKYTSCWREEYWDDPVSLGHKYDLVNQMGFRGVGIWTLDYGGGAPELWSTLASHFGPPVLGPANGYSSVLVNGDGHLETFYRQTDGLVYHSWQPNWGTWYQLAPGPQMQTAPVVALNTSGYAEAFAVGDDGNVYHTWQPGWSSWYQIGTLPTGVTFTGQPSVSRTPDWGVAVVVRGSDGAYWLSMRHASSWTAWTSLGGSFSSDPALIENVPDGHLELFGVSGGSVVHDYQSNWGWTWSGWSSLGPGSFTGRVAVARNASGPLEIFAVGTGGQLYHQYQTSSSWSGWWLIGGPPIGGSWQGNPSVTANPNGALEVFVRGPDNAIWHAWQPGWNPFGSIGGPIDGDPVALLEAAPYVDVWGHNPQSLQASEQWRGSDNVWSGWQPRGGQILVP